MTQHSDIVGIQSKRSVWIDAAKGFAILLVLINHAGCFECLSIYGENMFISAIATCLTYCSASYMPLFYFLSGYTYKERPEELRYRFQRLIIPYAAWGMLYLLIAYGLLYIRGGDFFDYLVPTAGLVYSRFSLTYEHLLYLFPAGAASLWFLTSLFTSYIFFIALKKSRMTSLLILVYAALTVLFTFCPILMPWSLDTAFAGALFIYAGYRAKIDNMMQLSKPILLAIVGIILPIYLAAVWFNGNINMSVRVYGNHQIISPLLFLIIGIMGCFLYSVTSFFVEKIRIASVLAYIGKISLTLLCCHGLCYHLIGKIGNLMPWASAYLFVFKIASAILFAILFHNVTNTLKRKPEKIEP